MTERIPFSAMRNLQFHSPIPQYPSFQEKARTCPAPNQTTPAFDYYTDPIKAASHIKDIMFPTPRYPHPQSVQVYIFTMENHFLIMMSPGALPFTPFTHSGDGLYQVNPLYQRPFFSYPVSTQTYQAIMREESCLNGIPPLMILKGTWNPTLRHPHHCYGQTSDLIIGRTTSIQTQEFALHKVENSWSSSDTLKGVAYSLGDQVFRVWFHEKNPKALVNAIGTKKDEIKQLKKLLDFLTKIPTFHAQIHDALFTSQQEIGKMGDWRNITTLLLDDHPDKKRPVEQRLSTKVQNLIKEFRDKLKEIKQFRKNPTEKQKKEQELEEIRIKLVAALRAFLDESMAWIDASPLSKSPNFIQGIQGAVVGAERELGALREAEPLLALPGKEGELKNLRCPTSAYRSTMQIESSTENTTPRQRLWGYIPCSIKLIDWYLSAFDRVPHRDSPPVPVQFFERAAGFLVKKEQWVRNHGFTSQMNPQRFLRNVRYHIDSLQHLHAAFKELRQYFTNGHIPQRVAAHYPYLLEEAAFIKEFVEEMEAVFAAVSPDYNFQFYQETSKLKEEQRVILAGGTLYKRLTDGGNVAHEFLEQGQRSQLNQENWVHTAIWV